MGDKVGTYTEQESKIFVQGLYEQSATQKQRIGTVRSLDDGRKYAYALAGETLAPGKWTMGPPTVGAHDTIAVAETAAVGAKRVKVTLGATLIAANGYRDGWLRVDDATYGGELYKVRGHAAIAASGSGYIDLYDSVRVAITAGTNTVSLMKSVQHGVLLGVYNAIAGGIAGVPPIDVTSGYYFWNQVKGTCSILTDGTVTLGLQVALSNATSGAVELSVPATTTDLILGQVLQVSATTLYSLINLNVPGY